MNVLQRSRLCGLHIRHTVSDINKHRLLEWNKSHIFPLHYINPWLKVAFCRAVAYLRINSS